jgi:hypothetical protein
MIPNGYTIQYQVQSKSDKQILQVWELDPTANVAQKPWLYQMNYELSDHNSACSIINNILEAAGASKISDYQFAKFKGKIKVMPNPTLKLFRQG